MVKINVDISDRLNLIRQNIRAGFTGNPGPIQDAFKQWAMRYRSEMQLRFNTYSRGGGDWPPLKRSTVLARVSKPIGRLKKSFARGDMDLETFNRRMKATKAKVSRERGKYASYSQRQKALLNNAATEMAAIKKALSDEAKGRINSRELGNRLAAVRERKAKADRKAMQGGSVAILRDTGLLFNTLDPAFMGAPGQLERSLGNGIEVGIGGPASHGVGPATIGDIASYHQTGAGTLPVREILVTPVEEVQAKMAGDLERAVAKIVSEHRG